MQLEDLIVKLIAALDANTAAHKGTAAPAGAKTTPPKATTTKPAIEFDAVKIAASEVVKKKDKAFAKNLIKTVGGANELAGVKPEKYAALMAAFEGALKEEPADEPEEDEEL
jgi:hypothetical protein